MPISKWRIGEENTIRYTLPIGYKGEKNDWIGMYKVNLAI